MDTDELLGRLRATVTGSVLTDADADYAAAVTGFDLTALHRPSVAVCATSVADVVATVRAAAESGIRLAVMGTGHAPVPADGTDARTGPGGSGGILLNLRGLNQMSLDADARTATVGPGASWRPVLAAAAPNGLAAVCGSAPDVGVVGFLLGGGVGPIGRTVGFGSDHVRSFDVVTADGSLRTVSGDREPDLFWAMRGGGRCGLGVVTAATVNLLPLATIYGGSEFYPAADVPALLRAFAELTADPVPDALTTSVAVLRMPDLPVVPPVLRGQTVGHLRVGYVGGDGADDVAAAQALLAPLRAAVSSPLLGGLGPLPYADIGSIHRDPTTPAAPETGGALLDRLDEGAVDALLAVAGPDVPTPLVLVELRHLGGAYASRAHGGDAVSGRGATHALWVVSAPPPGSDRSPMAGAVGRVLDAVDPWSTGTIQTNFCGSVNTTQQAAEAWSAPVRQRLASIKHTYDPQLVFG